MFSYELTEIPFAQGKFWILLARKLISWHNIFVAFKNIFFPSFSAGTIVVINMFMNELINWLVVLK